MIAARIRLARSEEADLLPVIERDAATAFTVLADYAWIAKDRVRSASSWREAIAAETCWVAVDGGDAPFGFLGARAEAGDLFIEEACVVREAQRAGAGTALFAAAIAHARTAGLRAVTLTTFRDVPWNAPAYARMGFSLLDDAALPIYLRAIRVREVDAGLPGDLRCAMEMRLLCEVERGG